jgi:hypothetical protein
MRAIVVALAIAGCSRPHHVEEGWAAVGVGTVFESETVTRLEHPFAHETTGRLKQTLVAVNDREASVRIELADGTTQTAQVVKMPLRHEEPEPCPGTTVTTSQEICTTPAGTFVCTRTTVEVRHGATTSSNVTWTAKAIPVPIKSIVSNENLTTTTELTRLEAGG